jgi:hypothetical protein
VALFATEPIVTSSARRVSPCDSVKFRLISRGDINRICAPIATMSVTVSCTPHVLLMSVASVDADVYAAL